MSRWMILASAEGGDGKTWALALHEHDNHFTEYLVGENPEFKYLDCYGWAYGLKLGRAPACSAPPS